MPEGLHHASTLLTGYRPTSVEEARVVICLNSKSDINFVLIFRGFISARCQHHQHSDSRAAGVSSYELFEFERQTGYLYQVRFFFLCHSLDCAECECCKLDRSAHAVTFIQRQCTQRCCYLHECLQNYFGKVGLS